MYGPTETTIWSSTQRVDDSFNVVPLGRPIANTQLTCWTGGRRLFPRAFRASFILGERALRAVILIAPILTAERFVVKPV